jgi:two-component system, sensor histidine kinase YesM
LFKGRRFLERIRLINVSIRTKLILIYLLCVLIPTIVFSYAFYSSTINSAKKEKLILYQQSVDRISSSIDANALSAIELSNIIFADEAMYQHINKQYTDKKQCMDDYNSYLQNAWNKILPYNTNIVLFIVYTDNGTLLNGKHLHRIDASVNECDWFTKYIQLNKKAAFISHTDEIIASTARVKLVSYIRQLNYLYSKNYHHFIKITFQSNMFDKLMRTEKLPGDIYVVNGDNQIVSQTVRTGVDFDGTNFISFSSVTTKAGQVVLSSPLKLMEGWRVVCVLQKDFMRGSFIINWVQILLLFVSVTVFASIAIYTIASSLYKRIAVLTNYMGKVTKEDYNLIPEKDKGNDEVGQLVTSMNSMITKIKLLIEDVYKAKIRETQLELHKKQSELNALQCQVNPHFMFNVLETIRLKSYMRNEFETSRIIKYMSRMFRKLLLWNSDLITLQEEIYFIKEYLEIQQYRYEDELKFDISIDESLLNLRIPKMALQTFVDNACEHGFSESSGLKSVMISAHASEKSIEISIFDNGKGMTPEQIQGIETVESRGIGIKNVIGRLELYYGGNYHFEIKSDLGRYTEIILMLDKEEMKRKGYV